MARGFGQWVAVVAWLFSSYATAGSWIGGGGEMLGDGNNPWFLGNTETVKACVTMDAEHFHLPEGKADPLHDFVEPALDYWRSELQLAETSDSLLKVGTQRFEFAPCAEDTQLRIQLGALTADQLQGLRSRGMDPRHLVSLAVRTDYDRVALRGRGFIYVAADSGELRPNSESLEPKPWADEEGTHLLKVLAHELGHVYGLAHTNGAIAGDMDLMNAAYPENIVDKYQLEAVRSRAQLPPFFRDNPAEAFSSHCRRGSLSARVRAFLEAEEWVHCLRFVQEGAKVVVLGDERSVHSPGKRSGVLGFILLNSTPAFKLAENQLIRVYLPPEQTVVPWPSANLKAKLSPGLIQYVGPRRGTYNLTGIYWSFQHTAPRPVLVGKFTGGRFRVAGLLDNGELLDFAEAPH